MATRHDVQTIERRTIAKVVLASATSGRARLLHRYIDRSNILWPALTMTNKDLGFKRLYLRLGRRHFLLQLFPVRDSGAT